MQERHNCVSLLGLDPSGQGKREYWIEKDLIQFFYKKSWMAKFHALRSVKEILENPAVIFRGLEREGQEEALCYAGVASHRYSNDGSSLSPPVGMTFVVYIRSDDVVFRWDWEPAEDLTYPKNYHERFGAQLWPKT